MMTFSRDAATEVQITSFIDDDHNDATEVQTNYNSFYRHDDATTEVQTNFVLSQNLVIILLFTIRFLFVTVLLLRRCFRRFVATS